jgi:hypothetical protein
MKKSTIKLGEGEIGFSLTSITKTNLYPPLIFPSLLPHKGRMKKNREEEYLLHESGSTQHQAELMRKNCYGPALCL